MTFAFYNGYKWNKDDPVLFRNKTFSILGENLVHVFNK